MSSVDRVELNDNISRPTASFKDSRHPISSHCLYFLSTKCRILLLKAPLPALHPPVWPPLNHPPRPRVSFTMSTPSQLSKSTPHPPPQTCFSGSAASRIHTTVSPTCTLWPPLYLLHGLWPKPTSLQQAVAGALHLYLKTSMRFPLWSAISALKASKK